MSTQTAVGILWVSLLNIWQYLVSNPILGVGSLMILLHLAMVVIDRIKKLI